MIRVQLNGERQTRRLIRAAITPLIVACALLAVAHWVDTRLGLLNLMRDLSLSEQTGINSSSPRTVHVDDDGEPVATGVASVSVDEREQPVTGRIDACHKALDLYGRLPRCLGFTSLSGRVVDGGRGGGEYTLEGISEPEEVATLFSFLDTLKSLPSEVNLSYWREGGVNAGDSYRFTFHGTFNEPTEAGLLAVIKAEDGSTLLSRVSTMAVWSGLDSLMTKGPVELPQTGGLGRLRQKHWAVGSYSQIQSFARDIEQMPGDQPVLAELVIMPGHGSSDNGSLQVYAALDVIIEGGDR